MQTYSSKRLSEIKTDFERGVFLALYNSRKQRLHRSVAGLVLGIKHVLRGLLFSWPLYLLTLAAYAVPGLPALVFVLLLVPAVYVSWRILSRGIKEDYKNRVEGYLLRPGYPRRMLFHKNHG
jgi:hypothetical protein